METTTPSIQCTNGGTPHRHSSTQEVRVCYGLLPPTALTPAPAAASGPSVLHGPQPNAQSPTDRQLWYIEQLGGKACRTAAKYLTRKQCSALIDELKNGPKEAPVSDPSPAYSPPPPPAPKVEDPRHKMIKAMLDMVPDGYYAVQAEEGGHADFLRISRPKKNKWAGAIKVQTVHGSPGRVVLSSEPVAALWPSGTFSVYKYGGKVEDMLLLLVANSQNAARLYAKLLEHCCRCNASLTDDRSRHYGIGPECEKIWPHIIEQVDAEDALAAS